MVVLSEKFGADELKVLRVRGNFGGLATIRGVLRIRHGLGLADSQHVSIGLVGWCILGQKKV